MQNTGNLWEQLCRDLERRQAEESIEQRGTAARNFEQAAVQVFQGRPQRLQDALEITGDIHQANGTMDDAIRCFGEAMKIARGARNHAVVARIATKLATVSEGRVDRETTVRFYRLAIESMESAQDRSQIPAMLSNLGSLQKAAGEMVAAEHSYRQALKEAQSLHGSRHPEVAVLANNLGVALTEQRKFDQAEDFHLMALAIREENFGGRHPEVAQSMSNLAAVYNARKRYKQAESYYRAAMDTLASFRGPDDPEMVAIREQYEDLPQVRVRNLSKTRRL
ncbi:MAG: tetratricopeptide repeat protein [Chthoniobacterales bacterium]